MKTNKTPQIVVAIAVFIVVISGFGVGGADAQTAGGDDRAAALRILELVNRDRINAGLPALAERADVTAVAASWSAAMAEVRVLSHSDEYFSEASRERLNARSLGENVASNGSVDDAHARLMASPGHHANIMSSKFTVVGIAVYRDERGTYWVTEDFLTPRSAPAPTSAPAPAPAAAPAPKPRPVTPVAAPAPSPAPVAVTPPATVRQQEAPPAQATVDTALISATPAVHSVELKAAPSTPITHIPQPAAGLDPRILAAAGFNALAALALAAVRRRHQAA